MHLSPTCDCCEQSDTHFGAIPSIYGYLETTGSRALPLGHQRNNSKRTLEGMGG